jgi:hypothetical protein
MFFEVNRSAGLKFLPTPWNPRLDCKNAIHNLDELKVAIAEMLKTVDLNLKKRDFEHLLFNKKNSERILSVGEFFLEMR